MILSSSTPPQDQRNLPKSDLPKAVFIMGPTGSGKTELAIQLIEQYPADIINVDSAQIYKGMNIGTAKPDADTLKKAPHRLLDFLDPALSYSAADFRKDALAEMEAIHQAGRLPILAGGTMLYFRALQYGLSDLPDANPAIRAKLDAEAEKEGWLALHQRLASIDPEAAARIHPNDPQRLQRALEVFEITGQTLTELHKATQGQTIPWNILKIALIPDDRSLLKQGLAHRFEHMLEAGLIDEVKQLYQRGDLNINMPSIRCVGYRQIWQYLNGDIDFNNMKKHAIVATHQLAKRQLTWLRSENGTVAINPQGGNHLSVEEIMRNFLTR